MANDKDVFNFLTGVSKLEPAEFFGFCKVLCVPIYVGAPTTEKKMRDLENITSDLIDKFCILNRKQKREILSLLKKI